MSAWSMNDALAVALADMASTPTDHRTLSPDVLLLNALAEISDMARMMTTDGTPSGIVRQQAGRAALRVFQAADAYVTQQAAPGSSPLDMADLPL